MIATEMLKQRAAKLRMWGLTARWDEVAAEPWVPRLIAWEEEEQARRSLEYRFSKAKLGAFKPMVDFDWTWPKRVEREAVEDLFSLGFLDEAANVVLVGPNGVGKTMIAQNLAHQALLRGHPVRFTTASDMLAELAGCESAVALDRALDRYARPQLLVVDEVGYLSYGTRHADLLYEVVTRRYGKRSTVLTTNRPFAEWGEVFPNAACVVTLVDRLLHRAEVIRIDGDSFRAKESAERVAARAGARKRTPKPNQTQP
jgi:DNA replication protein DnaC